MMTRASRLLKWIGAGTVLLAAAPVAYAENGGHTGYPASRATASSTRGGASTEAGGACGRSAADFAGVYLVVGGGVNSAEASTTLNFRADGSVSVLAHGRDAGNGSWLERGGEIVWTVDGVAYTSVAGATTCADPSQAARVSSIGGTAADGSAALTLRRF